MSVHVRDEEFMYRALELARQGIGLTSPNPCVGALVVDERSGEVLGSGSHTYEGRKHAEILALEQADERARGATLYLNLEPCSHHGRTGPCADAVIRSGVARVVAAIEDPNPQVSGQGLQRLKSAGIEVTTGICAPEARRLNEAFARYIRTRLPLVILKTAMTLDGKIAPAPGQSQHPSALGAAEAARGWITGPEARAHVHELRHAVDAIMVGVGTIVSDDPLLTDRSDGPRRRPLLRVIVDSGLRLPLESRVVKTANRDVLVFCSSAEPKKQRKLEARGVRVEQLEAQESRDGRPDLKQVVQRLGAMEVTALLVEGGSRINAAALAAGITDKIVFYYAPKILAGSGSIPFAAGEHAGAMNEAACVKDIRLERLGQDFAVEGYLHDPYGNW